MGWTCWGPSDSGRLSASWAFRSGWEWGAAGGGGCGSMAWGGVGPEGSSDEGDARRRLLLLKAGGPLARDRQSVQGACGQGLSEQRAGFACLRYRLRQKKKKVGLCVHEMNSSIHAKSIRRRPLLVAASHVLYSLFPFSFLHPDPIDRSISQPTPLQSTPTPIPIPIRQTPPGAATPPATFPAAAPRPGPRAPPRPPLVSRPCPPPGGPAPPCSRR